MAKRAATATTVRLHKEKRPGLYCSVEGCYAKTLHRYCPKHFHLWAFILNRPIQREKE